MTQQVYLVGELPEIVRANLAMDSLAEYPIQLTQLRVWDAITTLLPAAGASDDLGLVGGTFGSASPSLQTSDSKAASTTQRARFQWALPPEYVAAQRLRLRLHAGMLTTISDTTATVDVEVYESNREAGVGSDLCATSAKTINSLTLADKEFDIDVSGLEPGDMLDVRITIAIVDAATATAVKGVIGAIEWLVDIRG